MTLYKFRSFEKIERTIDIITNEHLYCAHYKSLNDPFEGLFSTIKWKGGSHLVVGGGQFGPGGSPSSSFFSGRHPETVYMTLDDLPALKKNTRICSLSESMADVKMWSLYASGHTGCVIEVDLEPDGNEIVKIDYRKGLQHFTNQLTNDTEAIYVLSFKTKHWAYEEEYRIFSEQKFYPVPGKITGIYLGIRVQDIHKEIIVRCTPKKIPVYETKLQEKTVEIKSTKRRIN